MPDSLWDLFRAGKTREGLLRMREAFSKDGSTSRAMELGVAYLWTEDYQSA